MGRAARMNVFERYLSVWVAACMLLGRLAPGLVGALRDVELGRGSRINLPIAVLIWLMIYPMMLKIDLAAHSSKSLESVPEGVVWDWVVTMGCGDACPHVPARRRLDWDLPDPKSLDDAGFRAVRDRIEGLVKGLVDEALAPAREP